MNDFKFVDELPSGHIGKPPDPLLQQFADALKTKPGIWAEWPKSSTPSTLTSLVTRINHYWKPGCPIAFKAGGFEARYRDGMLYVRYKGKAL